MNDFPQAFELGMLVFFHPCFNFGCKDTAFLRDMQIYLQKSFRNADFRAVKMSSEANWARTALRLRTWAEV